MKNLGPAELTNWRKKILVSQHELAYETKIKRHNIQLFESLYRELDEEDVAKLIAALNKLTKERIKELSSLLK